LLDEDKPDADIETDDEDGLITLDGLLLPPPNIRLGMPNDFKIDFRRLYINI
jgi:hypothetical protein